MNNDKEINKYRKKYSSFNIKPYLKSGLTEEEIYKLKEAFDLFDIELKNYLTPEELKKSLNDLGILSKNESINKLIENGIKKIDFKKFIDIMGAKVTCKNYEDVKKFYEQEDCLRRSDRYYYPIPMARIWDKKDDWIMNF